MVVYVVEILCDDAFYGWNLISIHASEKEAKKEAEEKSTDYEFYRHRAMRVLGA
jgi:hypothetical protein